MQTPEQCVKSAQIYPKRHQNAVINMILVSLLLTLKRFYSGVSIVGFEQVKDGSDRPCFIIEIDCFYKTLEKREPEKQNFQHGPENTTLNYRHSRKKNCLKIFLFHLKLIYYFQ